MLFLSGPWAYHASAQTNTWDWANMPANGNNSVVHDMAVDSINGAIYVVGEYAQAGPFGLPTPIGGKEGFLARLNLNTGAVEWSVRMGGSGDDRTNGVVVGAGGRIFVTGWSQGSTTAGSSNALALTATALGGSDAFVAAYGPTGVIAWLQPAGGPWDDLGSDIAFSDAGLSVLGSFERMITCGSGAGAIATSNVGNGGRTNVFLATWALDGSPQGLLYGTNAHDIVPQALATSAGTQYMSGTFGNAPLEWHAQDGTLLGATPSGTSMGNVFVAAISSVSNNLLWHRAISNPNDPEIAAYGLASDCDMVYVTGFAEQGARFTDGQAVSHPSSAEDYLYLAALSGMDGSPEWIRTAVSVDELKCAGVDIAVTASHDILLFGYFDERLRFDTGTDILGQQNQESAVIRFTPFGEIEWAGALSSNGDAKPTSIAVASFNGIILGGADQGSLQWGTSASVASGSQSPFVIKLTDTDASLLDGIRWRAPASLCSSSGPFDLSAGLSSRQRGAVTTVLGSVSVSAPNNIIGQPNGSGATMSTVSVSSMQLDLGQTLQAGDLLIFTWKRTSTGTATLGVQTSPDNVNYVTHSATPATASAFWVNQPFAVETTTRYLRIQLTSTIGAQIDAIRWIKGGPTDGEFSGTGVTHPILDPSTGGTGVRTISYTVSAGSCAFSTTRSITIDPSPSGTLSGPLSVCPGATTSYSLVSSNSSGQTWEISTNGGTNWTAVSSNPSSFDLSGISQPVQLRVVLASATCPVGTSNTLSIVPDNAPPTITGLPSDQALITGTSCGANFTWPRPSINDGCTTCDPGSVTGYTRLGVFNGHAYYLSTTTSYWPAANTAAQSTGGHLATISSVQENTWLAGITTGIGSYIGLNDIDNEGTWKWANGEPLTFTNWGPGRPNGWLLDDQDWGVLNAPSTGFWDDNGFLPLTPRRHLLEFDCAVWQTAGPASPATFPVGTTTVGYTAMDAQGNTSTASFHVVVSDGTKPIVTFPTTTVSIPASGWPGCSGLLPDLIPQATVDEACPVTLHQRPAPGASISNTDEVWIIATDASGNSDSLSVMVVLEDITPPVIASCPNGQTVVVANAGDPSVPFSYTIPTANDCSPVTASLETGYLPGALFPLGTTEVRWRFSDDAGRWSECSFMVTVGANDAPQLTCPTVPPVNTDPGSCTAVVNYPVPIGFDAQEGAINAILVPPSLPPGPFPVGSSLVTYTLQDLDGNSASCSFTVTVTDGEAPTITCPPSQSLHTAAFECSFPASWAVPVVTDNCPSCVPSAALSTYDLLGAHDGKQYYISVYDATYDAAIAAAQSMGHHLLSISTVEENDFIHASINAIGIDPVWIGLTDQIVEDEYLWHSGEPFVYENWVDGEPNNFGDEDAVMMTGDGEWNDVPVTITLPYIIEVPCPGLALNQTSGPPNGAPFPLGTTDVTYTVTDAAGRSADCLFSITIIDNIPPIFSNCPANDTLELVGNDCTTAYVFPTILSTDGNVCDGDTQSDRNTMVMLAGTTSELDVTGWSNIALPHGTHRFRETHADDEGNTSVCEWTITVEDVTAPEVVCLLTDSFPLYLNGDCDLAFPDLRSYVTAEDCNGATIDMFPEPGTLFHGENLVQMTMWITDSLGNGRPNNHTIWIHDNTAPTILCQDTLEVPSTNNCMGEVLVPGPILVEDNCGNPSWNVDAEDGMWPVGDSTVTYTVTDGRLTSTCSTVVRVLDGAPPTPTISADGPLAFCAGGSVTLTSSSATGNVWSTGETIQSITVNASGTYSVTVTNGNGCSATSAGTTVTVNPNPATPTISAGGPLTFCAGGSVTLTSSSATGNVWSTGATTQAITVSTSGTYSVTVTNGNGCSATSAGTTVTVNTNCDCLGVPGGTALPGSACNDGDPQTVNDTWNVNCTCAGTLPNDCLGVPGGTAQPGTACDDGLATTGNDTWNSNCQCVGELIDCEGVAGGSALPGTACDDGLATTGNDTWNNNCQCVGLLIDCEGVAGGTALPGTACNDNNPNTSNDTWNSNCQCVGVLPNDCLGVPGGTAQPGTACDDGLATTGNDTWNSNCQCVGLLIDCEGVAGGTALPGTACNDGLATTGNDTWNNNCQCVGLLIDCEGVAGGTALPGTACNDNNPGTINDTWSNNCQCVGVPTGCTNIVDLVLTTDANGNETSYEIVVEGTSTVVCSGSGFPSNASLSEECCLADGCYALSVFDAAGDGMTTGGYILRTRAGDRIIDNRNNFGTGLESAISGGQGFCLPMSNQGLVYTSCDKMDWVSGQYVVAAPNAAVSAEWIVGAANNLQDANSGYEFWIFDPNGSYSFRRFRSHSQTDLFGPASATRACHMRLNNWALSSQVPANVLMNVRVRSRVNGLNGEFGPACRLMIDPVRAACPLTKLMDVPGSVQFSCGVVRNWGAGNYVYARPVPGANRYQFRFSLPAEGFTVTRTSNTYFQQLNWTTSPLVAGQTYNVEVRASKDGGLTWCTNDSPWGDICQLTIANGTILELNAMSTGTATVAPELRMFPNPNRGDVLSFSLSSIEEGVNTVSVDIFDLYGKRVGARTIVVADGNVNTVLDLNGALAAGMYVVNITAGTDSYTERLVIQP